MKFLCVEFLVILNFAAGAALLAQPPDTLWTRTFGGTNLD